MIFLTWGSFCRGCVVVFSLFSTLKVKSSVCAFHWVTTFCVARTLIHVPKLKNFETANPFISRCTGTLSDWLNFQKVVFFVHLQQPRLTFMTSLKVLDVRSKGWLTLMFDHLFLFLQMTTTRKYTDFQVCLVLKNEYCCLLESSNKTRHFQHQNFKNCQN